MAKVLALQKQRAENVLKEGEERPKARNEGDKMVHDVDEVDDFRSEAEYADTDAGIRGFGSKRGPYADEQRRGYDEWKRRDDFKRLRSNERLNATLKDNNWGVEATTWYRGDEVPDKPTPTGTQPTTSGTKKSSRMCLVRPLHQNNCWVWSKFFSCNSNRYFKPS